MRAREVGGYEPDDRDQTALIELWYLSRTTYAGQTAEAIAKHGSLRGARVEWCVTEFLKKHDGEPHVARKWVYVWAVDNLDLMVVEARTVTVRDAWGHERVVGGFSDVGPRTPSGEAAHVVQPGEPGATYGTETSDDEE